MSVRDEVFRPEQYWMPAAQATADARGEFITKTYMHLAGAIAAFVLLETALLTTPAGAAITRAIIGFGQFGWLLVLGAFILVGKLASSWASSGRSTSMQYAGLGLYVVAEAIIFVPLLFIAKTMYPGAIETAGFLTLVVFAALSAVVHVTRKDFSYLGPALAIAGVVALGLIIAAAFIGFNLGIWFSAGMIVVASGYILYDTSRILHHFGTDQYVAASLELFASVALLFWYILRLVMSLSERR